MDGPVAAIACLPADIMLGLLEGGSACLPQLEFASQERLALDAVLRVRDIKGASSERQHRVRMQYV